MRASKLHKQWIKERNEALYSFDVEKFKRFYRKWEKKGYYTKPLPPDEIIEISMRKGVCAIANPRADKLAQARAWLAERGYHWTAW